MSASTSDMISRALDAFRIELPSWGFANTGTRFGKFVQPAAATTTEEKFSDAGQIHALTGVCPTVALHVLWDFPKGLQSVGSIREFSERYGVKPGSINPNLFQDQQYKFGSFGNPNEDVRARALQHTKESVEIAKGLQSATFPCGLRMGRTIPAPRIFVRESVSLKNSFASHIRSFQSRKDC